MDWELSKSLRSKLFRPSKSSTSILPARCCLPQLRPVFRRETTHIDSVGGVVRDYSLSGTLRSSLSYEHIHKQIYNGITESWFENGQLSSHAEFAHGQRVGEFRLYYANGQLKRRQLFDPAYAGTGECFLENGQPIAFFEYEIMPVYSEGDGSFGAVSRAVMRNVKYPKDARKANAEGKVLVGFVVTPKGEVAQIKVVKGVFPSVDAAALWAVQQLKPFMPGRQDGKPVEVSFTVPITFRLE